MPTKFLIKTQKFQFEREIFVQKESFYVYKIYNFKETLSYLYVLHSF